jgi:hypothetical protein
MDSSAAATSGNVGVDLSASVRAFGFSDTGESCVMATNSDVTVFGWLG